MSEDQIISPPPRNIEQELSRRIDDFISEYAEKRGIPVGDVHAALRKLLMGHKEAG